MSQLIPISPKDPNDVVDYWINWGPYLTKVNDTIANSDWPVITPAGLTEDSNTFTNTIARIWLSGGTPGTYRLTNRITTVGGRVRDKTITVVVKDL